ncbi:uncharacterized protein LOC121877236 [Homarus americanus]|uniref:uncharacterized protein LOC121877236 n=1 Tax=Homarus americanus TaxID=6706 RepID=UPI001C473B15|nr:uncharacterized protein LOC121877236 [Homarus americanus]
MVCRHCPRPPWRPAPIAFLLPPLLLSLALATTHKPHTNTTPPTLSYTPPPPTTQATVHHTHQYTHIHHQHFFAFAAARTAPEHQKGEKQCAAVAPLDVESKEGIPEVKLEAKCQTCRQENKEECLRGRVPCPTLPEALCSTEEVEKREEKIRKVTLRYCPHMALHSVMCEEQVESVINRTLAGCSTVARHLQEMDDMVGRVLHQQQALLFKYNCESNYSITQTCLGCQEAYRYWVCSQLFPYYVDGIRVKPCRRFCHDVEQKCPYFLPKDKPVAGEPTFLCQDPKIGELEEQESSYGPDSCCYHTCPTHQVMGVVVNEIPEHEPLPTLCSTCHSSTSTTSSSTTASTTTTLSSSSSSGDASTSSSGSPPRPLDQHKANHSQCLSSSGADSCLLPSHPSPVSPLSSASCSVISRKHCWTRTALCILLLYLVRTRVLLPRGFT